MVKAKSNEGRRIPPKFVSWIDSHAPLANRSLSRGASGWEVLSHIVRTEGVAGLYTHTHPNTHVSHTHTHTHSHTHTHRFKGAGAGLTAVGAQCFVYYYFFARFKRLHRVGSQPLVREMLC